MAAARKPLLLPTPYTMRSIARLAIRAVSILSEVERHIRWHMLYTPNEPAIKRPNSATTIISSNMVKPKRNAECKMQNAELLGNAFLILTLALSRGVSLDVSSFFILHSSFLHWCNSELIDPVRTKTEVIFAAGLTQVDVTAMFFTAYILLVTSATPYLTPARSVVCAPALRAESI